MHRVGAVVFSAFLLLQPAVWAKGLRCVGLYDVPNESGIPIPPERIIRVPDEQQSEAFSRLGSKTFAPLQQYEINQVLARSQAPDVDSLLTHQAEDAEDKAAQCRQMAEIPAFAYHANRMLETASQYEKYAAYLRSLPRELHAYLVKTKVLFEGTGRYLGYVKDHRLEIFHGSLGRGRKDPTDIAVVVLVETEIKDVYVSVGGAE